MDKTHKEALSIFYPLYLEKAKTIERKGLKFVQYTSAEAAMSIINNNEIWLRNSQCMNDFSEVRHGLDCLIGAYGSEDVGNQFKSTLDEIFPSITHQLSELFDSWIPHFMNSTYIGCVSEHLLEENKYGRLSMWRAYGGNRSVAIVFNNGPFFAETDVFQTYTNPVNYIDPENFSREFENLTKRIQNNIDFIQTLGKQSVMGYLFDLFKVIVLCSKHPGFKEEREWRVVYTPDQNKSKYIRTSIETINGIPQEVHKIPLENIPEEIDGVTIPELIDRIIIGPNDQQVVIGKTFAKLLSEAGCDNPYDKIEFSGIPLR